MVEIIPRDRYAHRYHYRTLNLTCWNRQVSSAMSSNHSLFKIWGKLFQVHCSAEATKCRQLWHSLTLWLGQTHGND